MSNTPLELSERSARRNKLIGSTVIIVAAMIAIAVEVKTAHSNRSVISKAFFSVDDGATYFADDKTKIGGFDHDGKPAYRAYLFRCENGAQFIGFLERFTPQGLKRIEEARAKTGASAAAAVAAAIAPTESEVKRPGESSWVKRTSPEASTIVHAIKCPDGSTTGLEPVDPS